MPPRRMPPRQFDRGPRRNYEPQSRRKPKYPDFFEDESIDDPPPPKKPLKI